MYGINDKVYENLLNYFERNTNIESVILFGSRAKGNEKHNSDIDLCIECAKKSMGTIEYEIDELIGIYSCDIVFADSLNEEIKKQIDRDGIVVYKKSNIKLYSSREEAEKENEFYDISKIKGLI